MGEVNTSTSESPRAKTFVAPETTLTRFNIVIIEMKNLNFVSTVDDDTSKRLNKIRYVPILSRRARKSEAKRHQPIDLLSEFKILHQDSGFIIGYRIEGTEHDLLANTHVNVLTPAKPAGDNTL
jgi:hypothetical protein